MSREKSPDQSGSNKPATDSQSKSASLTQGSRNATLSRHTAPGERICLARAMCEIPPVGSARPVECNLKTVAIIDDHPIFRGGVIQALMVATCFDVIAEGASRNDAIAIVERHRPDLIILEVTIPGGGVEAATEILKAYPNQRILFLTASEAESDVLSCLQTGALGYVLKGTSGSDLVNMANAVCRGDIIVTPSLAGRLLTSMQKRPVTITSARDDRDLTPRENDILQWVTEGKTNKEVARALDLTEKTVKHYMTNIMLKLGVRNRVEAAIARGPKQGPSKRT